MSEPLHTPGPWHYLAPVGSDNFRVDAWDRRHTLEVIRVAWVPNTIYTGQHGWPEHCERHANARLICAAPDLLAALKRAVEFEIKGADLLRDCKAAIAKAETLS